ncbi:MAG TPA: hypothetical protein PKV72_04885, partial [Candidatus Peribacteria bacterium]|nr:hypothetical protein [Candidatus Peribacteria bacterium]
MAAKTHPAPGEGAPDRDDAREAERVIQETAGEEAKQVGKFRAWIYTIMGLGGLGTAVYNAPDIVADPVRRLVGMQPAGKDEFKGPTAAERIAKARPDAKALVDRIIAQQPKVELNTVTDEQVRANIKGILADKNVS